jgi:hypothetical protein
MLNIVFVILIVVVILTFMKRRKQKIRTKQVQILQPGRTPESAITLHHPSEIKKFVRTQRCHCGGYISLRAEASVADLPKLYVAVGECSLCEDTHRFYFRIEYIH